MTLQTVLDSGGDLKMTDFITCANSVMGSCT